MSPPINKAGSSKSERSTVAKNIPGIVTIRRRSCAFRIEVSTRDDIQRRYLSLGRLDSCGLIVATILLSYRGITLLPRDD